MPVTVTDFVLCACAKTDRTDGVLFPNVGWFPLVRSCTKVDSLLRICYLETEFVVALRPPLRSTVTNGF